ncbi:MAG: hypothetical protein V1817_01470 [Candidatus Micrarchaeota archaeon]
MKIVFSGGEWRITRGETELDAFVKEFVRLLDDCRVNYALVSGYVAILFGRSRNSEDVDVFIERMNEKQFAVFWERISNDFEALMSPDAETALRDYLSQGLSVRFAKRGAAVPNVEIRFPKTELDEWTLVNAAKVSLNGFALRVSPLELQIPFKLYLGSDKDFEDAKHLWLVCREHVDAALLKQFIIKLKQENSAAKWLK